MHRGTFIFRFLPVLFLSFFLESCVVLNPIGDAISNGYENTLTYFNVYYNARRAFNNAETDIQDAARKAQGKTLPGGQEPAIPPDADKNLNLVIDKCSNILAYHAKSAFVDDALMMTGKAFYYKKEYSKAERKFLELITQYPNSSLNLEAQLWYAMSEEKLDEFDQARKSTDALIASLQSGGDRDLLARAYSLRGLISVHDGSIAPAIESYQNSEKVADSDQLKADAWYEIGRLYYNDGQYESAVNALLKVDDYSDNVYQIFQSKLLATQAYRNLKLLEKALTIENEMADDYRFKDYLGPVMLERANIFLAGKRYDEAVNIYRALDTTYARTETGALADYELGKYFELVAGDYANAKEFYRRSTMAPAFTKLDQAAHKVIAFNTYFGDWKELDNADSLLAIAASADTTISFPDSLPTAAKDTSLREQAAVKTTPVIPAKKLSADSLNAIKAKAAASLGELFYTDLVNPDSAIYWLRYSLLQQYVERSAPRILYMLSELATSYPDKTTVTSKEYEDQIVRDFPNSYFARQILHQDTSGSAEKVIADSAAIAYAAAEGLIESGKNEEALQALEDILARFPDSPHLAKCRYAIGWLYENRLGRMDSAAVEYKALLSQYPSTPYARAVSQRQLDTLASVTPQQVPEPSKSQVPAQKADSLEARQSVGIGVRPNPTKPPGALSRRAKILQSQQQRPKERE